MGRAVKKHRPVLDIVSIPRHLNLTRWLEIYRVLGLALWDSSLGGQPPRLLGRNIKAFKICDVSKNNPNLKKKLTTFSDDGSVQEYSS